VRTSIVAGAILAAAVSAAPASAYSCSRTKRNVDALWEPAIRPLLERRFPRATREEIRDARAYAYGGAVIQDLGRDFAALRAVM